MCGGAMRANAQHDSFCICASSVVFVPVASRALALIFCQTSTCLATETTLRHQQLAAGGGVSQLLQCHPAWPSNYDALLPLAHARWRLLICTRYLRKGVAGVACCDV